MTLAESLPGTWRVVATNFPMWLKGDKTEPRFTYGLESTAPLLLTDTVSYLDARGRTKTIVGTDTERNGLLRWRGRGLLALFVSEWTIAGATEQSMAIRFRKTLVTPAGVDLLVRDGSGATPDPAELGLDATEVASLSWL
jgi:hypothetical protein